MSFSLSNRWRDSSKLMKSALVAVAIAIPAGSAFAAATMTGPAAAGGDELSTPSGLMKQNLIEQNSGSNTPGNQPKVSNNGDSSQSVTSQTTIAATSNNGQTDVSVNGEPVPVPANGEVHKTITSNNGKTQVDISSSSSSDAANSSNTSINLNVSSSSADKGN